MAANCLDLLPMEFQPYHEQLAATRLPHVCITATPGSTTLVQSKFLGLPYLPQDWQYPYDRDGLPMLLLAQLNFADIPSLPGFPTCGILQIFIASGDEFYGADFDSFETMQLQRKFRTRFFEKTEDPAHWTYDFEFLRTELSQRDLIIPIEQECQLTFELQESLISPTDYRFEQTLGPDFFKRFGVEQDECQEAYWQSFSAQGHRMGGYAFFTQTDPRHDSAQDEDWVLLLQIDSDETAGIMWGDLGVGHFFIPRANLLRRDFSRILYTWDCG